jgi:hypothetical protein
MHSTVHVFLLCPKSTNRQIQGASCVNATGKFSVLQYLGSSLHLHIPFRCGNKFSVTHSCYIDEILNSLFLTLVRLHVSA